MQRTIIVTGCSSGIGKEICLSLLGKGHIVLGISRSKPSFTNPSFHFFPLNLCDLASIPTFIPQLLSQFPSVDTLICNAGMAYFGHLEQLSYEQISQMIFTNFTGHAFLVKALLPHLKKHKRADILFIGSEASLAGKRKGSIYCAAKFALRGFAQALREECSKNHIRISQIQPGMVRTPFYDLLDFSPGEEKEHSLLPKDIATVVAMVLQMGSHAVCDEIILSPLKKVIAFKKNK